MREFLFATALLLQPVASHAADWEYMGDIEQPPGYFYVDKSSIRWVHFADSDYVEVWWKGVRSDGVTRFTNLVWLDCNGSIVNVAYADLEQIERSYDNSYAIEHQNALPRLKKRVPPESVYETLVRRFCSDRNVMKH